MVPSLGIPLYVAAATLSLSVRVSMDFPVISLLWPGGSLIFRLQQGIGMNLVLRQLDELLDDISTTVPH